MGRRDIIITGLFAVLAIGGGAVVTGLSSTVNTYTPYLLSVGWLALLAALAGLTYMFRTAPKAAFAAAQEALVGPPPREFLPPEITWEVLSKKIEGRTSLQIEALARTYAGKWMRVSGRITDVMPVYDGFGVHLREDGGDRGLVTGYFGPDEADRMAALNKGDWIRFVGKVERLMHGGSMADCEIEHIGEPPKPAAKPRAPRKPAPPKPSSRMST